MLGHCRIAGKCTADELARSDTSGCRMGKLASCGASFELGKCWSDTSNFVTTRFFWPRSNRKRSNDFLAFSKVHLSTVIEALTGHCPLGIYAVRLTILPDANCLNEHEIESSQHFLFECPLTGQA